MGTDIWIVFEWWGALFLFGAFAYPLTRAVFSSWWDKGYLCSKAVGLAVVTFIVYLTGTLRMLPFTRETVFLSIALVMVAGLFFNRNSYKDYKTYTYYIFEELFFFIALLFWAWIKGHQPAIRDLEKFMDFGFTKSVLDAAFFPARDMWYAGGTINYYYFGHIALALLTKFSGIDLAYTFNLMLATIFAFTLTMSFSIGMQIGVIREIRKIRGKIVLGGLTAFLVTLSGNLQTIYAFTPGYTGDKPVPFWQLGFSLTGLINYWYANATRFIPYSIHEFPSYSFVVSDIHGHVLSLPFVLLAIALLIEIFGEALQKDLRFSLSTIYDLRILFYGFLVGILLMTNALDGPIYLGLFVILFFFLNRKSYFLNHFDWKNIIPVGIVVVAAGFTSLPFLIHFKSFVSGLGVNCPPVFLQMSKIGPFLFEGAEKCQKSPLWMLLLLWGFFLYCGIWFLGKVGRSGRLEKLLVVFFVFSIGLIIFPEFFYFKDIYPMHFRSNTMFKLGYQAFILFSIVSAYAVMTIKKKIFYLGLAPLLFLVSMYPWFSVRSYFNALRAYEGLYGLTWLSREYPDNFAAIGWLKAHADPARDVIVEADGDSYTDYNHVSTFTGLPTVVGWAVHEWLWRGSYEAVAPRREDVRRIYEMQDSEETRQLIRKYHVTYVFIGRLEREKFKLLYEEKFRLLGQEVFRSGQTVVYRI